MSNNQSRFIKETTSRLSMIISLILITAGAVLAQGPPAGAGRPAITNPKGDTDAQTGREASLRSAEMPATADQSA